MKQIITKEEVAKAISDLAKQGKKPTLHSIYAALNNRGSMSTLIRLKAEIEAASQPVTESPDGLKTFREVWALAVEEGRKQQEDVNADLRDNLKALFAENERLEGLALASQNRATELESSKTQAETDLRKVRTEADEELKQSKSALAGAIAQAAAANQKLAEAQASHAGQVIALHAELAVAVGKAHEFELKFVRAAALLEAKGNQPAPASTPKTAHPDKKGD